MTENLQVLTAQVVSAYTANNSISASELPGLITSVYNALSVVDQPQAVEQHAAPAVPVKKSIKPEAITCLECGKPMKMLKRHLSTDHGLTVAEYRAKWNLPSDYPMVAPDYAARRSELAVKIGLGRKPKAEAVAAVKTPKPRAKKV
jgi:predicted transcriptional regulator